MILSNAYSFLLSGQLDAESSLSDQSEEYFTELRNFRQVNKDECFFSSIVREEDVEFTAPPLVEPQLDLLPSLDTHQCTHCYRVDRRLFTVPLEPEAACAICKLPRNHLQSSEQKPAFIRISIPRSTLLPAYKYKAHRRKSFDPTDSLSLPSHCLSGWSNNGSLSTSHSNSFGIRKVRDAYLQFMVTIATMVREDKGLERNDSLVQQEMMQVLELETDIANGFNWLHFIQGVLSSVNVAVKPQEELVVYGVPYLQRLQGILSVHSTSTLQNYLTWQLLMDRVSSLSRRFKEARAHYRKALYGTTVEETRWRDCVRYVQSHMENAVGALYVRETFAGHSKQMVSKLIDKIRQAFVETLDELPWMDKLSKEKAQEKAMAIKEQIGYPDYILEDTNPKLDMEYAHLNFSEDNYFENTLENLRAGAQKSLRKLRERVDPELWIIGAAVVNAFYSPNRNQIVFPAGILQPPFFSQDQLQALNFGGIGMVIGHEITHGFDDNGRNFDKEGNMFDWWSNFSAMNFRDQSRCMVNQYGSYTWKLAGGQNAYMKWIKTEGEEPQLPGLNLNYKQLFFLNFAQVWCGSYRPEYASQSIKTDSHSPLEYRVIGSLQNFAAFSEAFHCKLGSTMHPYEKCRVW
ncbi:MMEL1 protein, partial [Polypterus senegalus]